MAAESPQPAQQKWVTKPKEHIPGCPPDLEYLNMVDQLFVNQNVVLVAEYSGWETSNRYEIMDSKGQQIFFANEESSVCMRQCCGSDRKFVMHITDNNQLEVMRVTRESTCCAGCRTGDYASVALEKVMVEAPPRHIIGYVKQFPSRKPKISIRDANDQEVLSITGPCCGCQALCCTADVDYKVLSVDGNTEVGKISKQWAGLVKDMFIKADQFGVTFPMDLEVKTKACLLAATLLIDVKYFAAGRDSTVDH